MRQLPHFQPPGEDAAGDAVPLSYNPTHVCTHIAAFIMKKYLLES
jgi:hypothetical protein